MENKDTVLCYIFNKEKVLLLYRNKKNKDPNIGKWIGVGGHIENGESKEEALLREVKEETGLTLLEYKLHATIFFKDNDYKEKMYLYSSSSYVGNLIDCNEGELKFIDIDKINSLSMWEGDHLFLNKMLASDVYFELELIYNNGVLIEYRFK